MEMPKRPVGIVLDFKRKRVVTVMEGNKKDEQNLTDALTKRVKATTTTVGVAPPPPKQKPQ
jgi:hypothetical protein